MLTSIIIRTLNEEKYLDELLIAISKQQLKTTELEVVIVDSGSTDNTLSIAASHNCRVTHIKQADFTFGRSLNDGCEFATGKYLVFVSGHCIPTNTTWLEALIQPLHNGDSNYVYGRQQAFGPTKFSEKCHFDKWFPKYSKNPQNGYFCNNANAALTRESWLKHRFNEDLTGLEDMFLAKQLVAEGEVIVYAAPASVYHIHEESWNQLKTRYEREAIALQLIMPEVHFSFIDFFRYYLASIFSDTAIAVREKTFFKNIGGIFIFRFAQYWGTYKGNHTHRKLSSIQKRNYFYPKDIEKHNYGQQKSGSVAANESK